MKGGVSAGTRLLRMMGLTSAAAMIGIDRSAAEYVIGNPYGKRRPQRDRIVNRANQEYRREEQKKRYKVRSAYQNAVNALTNWERNQWARAGYPGQKSDDVKQVEQFSSAARRRRLERLAMERG